MARVSWQVRWTEVEISNMISEVAKVLIGSGEKLPLGAAAIRAQQSLHIQGRLGILRIRPDESIKTWAAKPSVKALLNEEISRQIKSGETKPAAGFVYDESRAKELKLDKALEKAESLNVEQAMMIEQLQKALATSNLLLGNLQHLVMSLTQGGAERVEPEPETAEQESGTCLTTTTKHRVLVVGPLDSQKQILLNHCPENIQLDFVSSADPAKRTRAKVNGGRMEAVVIMVDYASVCHKAEAKRHSNMIAVPGQVRQVVERIEALGRDFQRLN